MRWALHDDVEIEAFEGSGGKQSSATVRHIVKTDSDSKFFKLDDLARAMKERGDMCLTVYT
jgi:hypothetical protein